MEEPGLLEGVVEIFFPPILIPLGIDAAVNVVQMPHVLPEEVYEKYQAGNASDCYGPGRAFHSGSIQQQEQAEPQHRTGNKVDYVKGVCFGAEKVLFHKEPP